MLSIKDFQNLEKMGIVFKLSADGKYANVYKKTKFAGTIYNTKNTVFFCGKEFVETSGKDIIEYLNTISASLIDSREFSYYEVFEIWKRCVLEKKCGDSFDKEFGKEKGYFYGYFRKLKLPKSFDDRDSLDSNTLEKIMAQKCYNDVIQYL